MKLARILETVLYVTDLAAAREFYTRVLGFALYSEDPARHVFLQAANGMLLLFNAEETAKGGELLPHGARGPQHVAFAVELAELDAWADHLAGHGVPIAQDVAWPNGARSLYFHDPSGNVLELASPNLWRVPESARGDFDPVED